MSVCLSERPVSETRCRPRPSRTTWHCSTVHCWVCLSIRLSVCLSVCPSICLFVSVYLWDQYHWLHVPEHIFSKLPYSPTKLSLAVCRHICRLSSLASSQLRHRSSNSDQPIVPSFNLTSVSRRTLPSCQSVEQSASTPHLSTVTHDFLAVLRTFLSFPCSLSSCRMHRICMCCVQTISHGRGCTERRASHRSYAGCTRSTRPRLC